MERMIDAALKYAARGWHVFPLLERDKRPRFAGAYKRATTDAELIRRWWRQWPSANIGIATGSTSGIWVLDVDGIEGEGSFVELAKLGEIPETRMVETRAGWHLYWALGQATDPGRRIGVRPGLDVIGGSGYLLAPPSAHPSGHVYAWANEEVQLAEAPTWMLAALERRREERPRRTVMASSPAAQIQGIIRRARADIASAGAGTRNVALFRAAVWVAEVATKHGHDASSALAELWSAAQRTGLPDGEIERTLRSAQSKGERQ